MPKKNKHIVGKNQLLPFKKAKKRDRRKKKLNKRRANNILINCDWSNEIDDLDNSFCEKRDIIADSKIYYQWSIN